MKNDPAHQATDAVIAEIEKKITKEYKKAHKEVAAKMDDYLARFATKDATWQKWVADGVKTQADYAAWKKGQVLMGQRWADLKDTLAKDYANAAKISQSIANGYRPEVYAINHNYATFEIEKGSRLNTSYTLYSKESVERMYRDNPRLYHKPGQSISEQIKEGKLARWDKRRIQSVITQGILQGESIPDLTKRLEKVTGGDHKAAIRNIRTMMTGVENAGRVDAQDRAKSMGIPVVKRWLATLDSRTRHWHRQLDGVEVETDEPFENEFGKIMFPGDPDADPANIYNCRCTLLSSIKGHELDIKDERVSYADEYADMTYDEWKEAKKSYSNPIDLPEKKAAAFKQSYINEYAGGHGGQGGQHAHTAAEGQRIVDQYNQDQSAAQAAKQAAQKAQEGAVKKAAKPKQNKPPYPDPEKCKTVPLKDLRYQQVQYLPVEIRKEAASEADIIRLITGADRTKGSCSSLAFAYAGNKAGYIVRDFRDGASREFFASRKNIRNILFPVKSTKLTITKVGENLAAHGMKMLQSMQKGEEYYFAHANHAAIVRINPDNGVKYQYLELQVNAQASHWKDLDESVLKRRFRSNNRSIRETTSMMTNIKDIAKNKEFGTMLGYINTPAGLEVKGAGGGIR